MSAQRRKGTACGTCGGELPKGRRKFCSDACYSQAANARRHKTVTPCKSCGGDKEPGVRGSKYCAACRELMADTHQQYEIERTRRKVIARRTERLAAGERIVRRDDAKPGQKWCPRCQTFKPHNSFNPRKDSATGLNAYCKPCQRSYNRERRMRVFYGLTYDEFDLLLACQDGRCAICGGRPRKHGLAVDHDHKTGEIRGLLCSRCNHRLLGSANDDPARLRKAADYLEEFGPREVFGAPRFIPGFPTEDAS